MVDANGLVQGLSLSHILRQDAEEGSASMAVAPAAAIFLEQLDPIVEGAA